MKIRLIWLLLLCLTNAQAAEKPNVLIIVADDLGYSDLSCYGSEIPTPNIDKIAAAGVRFTKCYNSARCCPTRASLMTGLYPHEAGIGSFTSAKPSPSKGSAYTGHLLDNNVTIAELLKNHGYSTWMVGKWHMEKPGPIQRGFENYYGFRSFASHSENQWQASNYIRLPEGTKAELSPEKFYATDVFTDYTLEFIKQSRAKKKPWFGYLAHSSPHFPIQAPRESIEPFMPIYRKGWDELREARFERMKKIGLIPATTALPPLSQVPVESQAIANGYAGQPNPAWNSLAADRREDLARRMAIFAAMVQHIDRGVGRILDDLEKNGELANTMIIFTSDNGACYEWGPFGFDGASRAGITDLHTGDELLAMGQDGTHHSYGSGWANLCNTPLNMYKHFCHEGGISSPLIIEWPAGIKAHEEFITTPAHVMDLLPTIAAVTGASYPLERQGVKVLPLSGVSLLPAIKGDEMPERFIASEHEYARGLRKGEWKIVWGKRQPEDISWELFHLSEDPCEQNDLASKKPEKRKELVELWNAWAKKVGVHVSAKK
jgi:arylsulfatase A-like enzyme